MAVTIQLKRGSSDAWRKLNPILAIGEPGFEKDTNRLKIGDGVTPWNNLKYQDENKSEFFNAETIFDFPSEGRVDVLYKASQTAKLYQWNPTLGTYEVLSSGGTGEGINPEDIKIIYGGNANGTT